MPVSSENAGRHEPQTMAAVKAAMAAPARKRLMTEAAGRWREEHKQGALVCTMQNLKGRQSAMLDCIGCKCRQLKSRRMYRSPEGWLVRFG